MRKEKDVCVSILFFEREVCGSVPYCDIKSLMHTKPLNRIHVERVMYRKTPFPIHDHFFPIQFFA